MNRRFRKTGVAALAVMAGLGLGSMAWVAPSLAESAAKPAAAAPAPAPAAKPDAVAAATTEEKALLKTVDEAYKAMREVRAARLAIFNGQVDVATNLVKDAATDMQAAQASLPTHAIKGRKAPDAEDAYLPIDASMTLAEGFVPSAEKQATIDEANQHLANGDGEKAAEVLKLAKIDVTISTALIPAKAGLAHIQDAAKLMGEQKYYEANLALKAAESLVVIDSYSLDAVPRQG